MNLAAIQTNYAGHRFRSRLEARYAVFFDALNIAWEYEAQGYEVEDRLNFGTGTGRYLPDFWTAERLGVDPITAAMRVRSHADRGYTSARSARFEHGEVPAL